MIGDDCMHNNHKLNNESLQIYQILPFGARKKKNIAKKVCQSLVTGWTLIQELKIWDDLSIKNTEKIGLNYLTIKNRN